MSMVDKFRKLPTAMIILHIASKAIIALGLGALLAQWIGGFAWWLIIAGVVLSVPPVYMIFKCE